MLCPSQLSDNANVKMSGLLTYFNRKAVILHQNNKDMSKLIHINKEYAEWVKSLSQRFRQSQIKAAVKVNSEMLKYYWSLGRDIVAKDAVAKWGDKIFITLSADLKDALPGVSGLSVRNLQYMRQMYNTIRCT